MQSIDCLVGDDCFLNGAEFATNGAKFALHIVANSTPVLSVTSAHITDAAQHDSSHALQSSLQHFGSDKLFLEANFVTQADSVRTAIQLVAS